MSCVQLLFTDWQLRHPGYSIAVTPSRLPDMALTSGASAAAHRCCNAISLPRPLPTLGVAGHRRETVERLRERDWLSLEGYQDGYR